MRLDRLITLNLVRPLRRADRACDFRLPILMYHSISANAEPTVAPYYQTNTSPAVFRQHLRQLSEAGFRTLDLAQALNLLRSTSERDTRGESAKSLSEKIVVITFDDGYRNFDTEAFPLLREYGFTATVFLPTVFIGDDRRCFKYGPCLTWDEVKQLRADGIHFGSHTVNHPRLAELSWTEIERELRDSKSQLEQRLGEPITTFAYPYAFPQSDRSFAQTFRKLLVETGYAGCVTTELGRVKLSDDPYRLKRLPANSLDDRALFQAKLDGSYDWLAIPQALVKRLKRSPLHSGQSQQNRCSHEKRSAMQSALPQHLLPPRDV